MPKVLIYITTQMSTQHKEFLKHCWPLALKNSHLLNSSDVKIYITPITSVRGVIPMLKETFKGQKLTYHIHENLGLIDGAINAITFASKEGWFEGYDWVFRMNPDVIIQNDTWMLDTITNDPDASLLYTECRPHRPPVIGNVKTAMTDFFALKPSAFPNGRLHTLFVRSRNAENQFTEQMREVIEKGQHRHVPDAFPLLNNGCRVNGNPLGPVVHYHDDAGSVPVVKDGVCPATFPNLIEDGSKNHVF